MPYQREVPYLEKFELSRRIISLDVLPTEINYFKLFCSLSLANGTPTWSSVELCMAAYLFDIDTRIQRNDDVPKYDTI